jgi:hypothetical protein
MTYLYTLVADVIEQNLIVVYLTSSCVIWAFCHEWASLKLE